MAYVVGLSIVMVLCLLVAALLYNGLVVKRNACDTAWASVDTQLQRRHDLIPNVVATVSGVMTHEREVLAEVSRLRTQALAAPTATATRLSTEDQLGGALSALMVRMESYPDLRSNENALHLQRLLTEVESQLSASRRAFNASIERYNNSVQTVPSSLIAGPAGFTTRAWFGAEAPARSVPEVGL